MYDCSHLFIARCIIVENNDSVQVDNPISIQEAALDFKEITVLISMSVSVANRLKLPSQIPDVLTEAFCVKCNDHRLHYKSV